MIALRRSAVAQPAGPTEENAEASPRLLDIFEQLETGQIGEEEAVKLLRERRRRRYGRVGRLVEAIVS